MTLRAAERDAGCSAEASSPGALRDRRAQSIPSPCHETSLAPSKVPKEETQKLCVLEVH